MSKPVFFCVSVFLSTLSIAAAQEGAAPAPPPGATSFWGQNADVDALRQELRQVLQQQLQTPPPGAAALQGKDALRERARALGRQLRDRLYARFLEVTEREMGPMQGLQLVTVPLEALDERGRVVEVPVNVQTRPLRRLTDAVVAPKMSFVMGTDDLALSIYDALPSIVEPAEREPFRRTYTGEAAEAIATEAKVIVALKGGEWREPQGDQPIANAVAIRGLDIDKGLLSNGNKTYDDTLYVVVDAEGATEVYEYRMTTESSNEKRGIGRLDSKQVIYVRGLHRGKDPAYRLKEESAEGTRQGLKGTYKITGANVHSAYSRRLIDSTTPLSPNVSLGCQVIAAGKSAFEKEMVFFLDKKGVKEFPYTIVDGEELSALDRALLQQQHQSILAHAIRREAASVSSTSD